MKKAFQSLEPWLDEILLCIKKDIKTDYLPGTPLFFRTHFGNRPLIRVTFEEIQKAFAKELLEGNDEMAEWVVNRWVFKHGDLYSHFAERLVAIDPDFDALQELTQEQSEKVLAGALEKFGVKAVYFFSVLNKVVFPAAVFDQLRKLVEKEVAAAPADQTNDLAKLIERHQREIARYEDKIAGVLKKYTNDVDALKKQVRALQHKLIGKA